MLVKQISIFLENKSGRIAEVTSVLAEAGINIRTLSLADTTDFGVLRLILSDADEAEKTLKNAGLTVRKTDVVAVEVEDKPGGLNNILDILGKSEVNIEYMYTYVHQAGDNAVMIFKFTDIEKAISRLGQQGINIIDGSTVYDL